MSARGYKRWEVTPIAAATSSRQKNWIPLLTNPTNSFACWMENPGSLSQSSTVAWLASILIPSSAAIAREKYLHELAHSILAESHQL